MTSQTSSVLAWHQTRKGSERLKELVGGSAMARLAGLEGSQEEFERKAVHLKPDILLVELKGGVNGTGDLLKRLSRNLPRASLVVLSDTEDPQHILSAMRAGVREYLTEPVSSQAFNDAVLRLSRQARVAGKPQGDIVSVMGAKGGVGASSLAVSLGWCMSRQMEQGVALVDLDLYSGDLAHLLDIKPQRNLADVAAGFERLDNLYLNSLLCEVSPNLRLLAAPDDPVAAEDVHSAQVDRALDHLADSHGMVVLDLPCRLDEMVLTALDRSSLVLLVLEPTVVSLKAANRFMALSQRLWKDSNRLGVVLNRDGARGCLSKKEVERAIGRDVLASLPNDSRTLMEAGNAGRPAAGDRPKAKWSKAVDHMVEEIIKDLGESNEPA